MSEYINTLKLKMNSEEAWKIAEKKRGLAVEPCIQKPAAYPAAADVHRIRDYQYKDRRQTCAAVPHSGKIKADMQADGYPGQRDYRWRSIDCRSESAV